MQIGNIVKPVHINTQPIELGDGFKNVSGDVVKTSLYESKSPPVRIVDPKFSYRAVFCNSLSELIHKLNVSLGLTGQAYGVTLDAKGTYTKTSDTKLAAGYYFVELSFVHDTVEVSLKEFLGSDPSGVSPLLKIVKAGPGDKLKPFYEVMGDEFVSRVEYGKKLVAVVEFEASHLDKSTSWMASLDVSGSFNGMGGGIKTTISNLIQSIKDLKQARIQIIAVGFDDARLHMQVVKDISDLQTTIFSLLPNMDSSKIKTDPPKTDSPGTQQDNNAPHPTGTPKPTKGGTSTGSSSKTTKAADAPAPNQAPQQSKNGAADPGKAGDPTAGKGDTSAPGKSDTPPDNPTSTVISFDTTPYSALLTLEEQEKTAEAYGDLRQGVNLANQFVKILFRCHERLEHYLNLVNYVLKNGDVVNLDNPKIKELKRLHKNINYYLLLIECYRTEVNENVFNQQTLSQYDVKVGIEAGKVRAAIEAISEAIEMSSEIVDPLEYLGMAKRVLKNGSKLIAAAKELKEFAPGGNNDLLEKISKAKARNDANILSIPQEMVNVKKALYSKNQKLIEELTTIYASVAQAHASVPVVPVDHASVPIVPVDHASVPVVPVDHAGVNVPPYVQVVVSVTPDGRLIAPGQPGGPAAPDDHGTVHVPPPGQAQPSEEIQRAAQEFRRLKQSVEDVKNSRAAILPQLDSPKDRETLLEKIEDNISVGEDVNSTLDKFMRSKKFTQEQVQAIKTNIDSQITTQKKLDKYIIESALPQNISKQQSGQIDQLRTEVNSQKNNINILVSQKNREDKLKIDLNQVEKLLQDYTNSISDLDISAFENLLTTGKGAPKDSRSLEMAIKQVYEEHDTCQADITQIKKLIKPWFKQISSKLFDDKGLPVEMGEFARTLIEEPDFSWGSLAKDLRILMAKINQFSGSIIDFKDSAILVGVFIATHPDHINHSSNEQSMVLPHETRNLIFDVAYNLLERNGEPCNFSLRRYRAIKTNANSEESTELYSNLAHRASRKRLTLNAITDFIGTIRSDSLSSDSSLSLCLGGLASEYERTVYRKVSVVMHPHASGSAPAPTRKYPFISNHDYNLSITPEVVEDVVHQDERSNKGPNLGKQPKTNKRMERKLKKEKQAIAKTLNSDLIIVRAFAQVGDSFKGLKFPGESKLIKKDYLSDTYYVPRVINPKSFLKQLLSSPSSPCPSGAKQQRRLLPKAPNKATRMASIFSAPSEGAVTLISGRLGEGSTINFRKKIIPGDGNCAFTALNVTRKSVHDVLSALENNDHTRGRLFDEIRDAFADENHEWFGTKIKQQFTSFQSKLQDRQSALGKVMTKVRKHNTNMPEYSGSEVYQQSMQWLHDNDRVRYANKIDKALLRERKSLQKFREFCTSQENYRHYCDAYLHGLWLGCESAMIFAQHEGFPLYIWNKPEGSDTLTIKSQHVPGSSSSSQPKEAVHLLFSGGNHFDLLMTIPEGDADSSTNPSVKTDEKSSSEGSENGAAGPNSAEGAAASSEQSSDPQLATQSADQAAEPKSRGAHRNPSRSKGHKKGK